MTFRFTLCALALSAFTAQAQDYKASEHAQRIAQKNHHNRYTY